mmetsp:Transcript_15147/g.43748  ORF Transcript_15147/g.43748 Transcript_15147/m.43748 type:complete len:271 (-) Transcript_15147:173-985(-)|eukprot:CAMPEP_0176070580 /NCGR_PEP_ID=MMETSP0120_2-20121206/35248_1 /TAXON_ID=160619 /ORGANISM="Kryptoperidinium foliaceum, Strain CCMP 1326" /LENGTH=270 /DNA_ID=CAMNT_0017404229 /DNA_START=71 /DNA_END=883 /DNA_ORIENTATION=-
MERYHKDTDSNDHNNDVDERDPHQHKLHGDDDDHDSNDVVHNTKHDYDIGNSDHDNDIYENDHNKDHDMEHDHNVHANDHDDDVDTYDHFDLHRKSHSIVVHYEIEHHSEDNHVNILEVDNNVAARFTTEHHHDATTNDHGNDGCQQDHFLAHGVKHSVTVHRIAEHYHHHHDQLNVHRNKGNAVAHQGTAHEHECFNVHGINRSVIVHHNSNLHGTAIVHNTWERHDEVRRTSHGLTAQRHAEHHRNVNNNDHENSLLNIFEAELSNNL